jgi:hypothetical protein
MKLLSRMHVLGPIWLLAAMGEGAATAATPEDATTAAPTTAPMTETASGSDMLPRDLGLSPDQEAARAFAGATPTDGNLADKVETNVDTKQEHVGQMAEPILVGDPYGYGTFYSYPYNMIHENAAVYPVAVVHPHTGAYWYGFPFTTAWGATPWSLGLW